MKLRPNYPLYQTLGTKIDFWKLCPIAHYIKLGAGAFKTSSELEMVKMATRVRVSIEVIWKEIVLKLKLFMRWFERKVKLKLFIRVVEWGVSFGVIKEEIVLKLKVFIGVSSMTQIKKSTQFWIFCILCIWFF